MLPNQDHEMGSLHIEGQTIASSATQQSGSRTAQPETTGFACMRLSSPHLTFTDDRSSVVEKDLLSGYTCILNHKLK
jgi:hypothetical protein